MSPLGRCLIDTCSDVSVARRYVLADPHLSDEPIIVGHMGGETTLFEAGTLEFERSDGAGTITLTGLCIVEPDMLPAGIVALLGVGDIQRLGMSLDAIMASPDCFWEQSVPVSFVGRLRKAFQQCFGWCRPARLQPPRSEPASNAAQRPAERPPSQLETRTPPREPDEGLALLEGMKEQLSEEQRRRTANRVAQLFREGLDRKHALQAQRAAQLKGKMPISKGEFDGEGQQTDPRARMS
jgi:hypothetical protein